MASCSVITGKIFGRHNLPMHPENQERLRSALSGVPDHIPRVPPLSADPEDIVRIHDRAYLNGLDALCRGTKGIRMLDPDTYIVADSYAVALAAAGSAIDAVERSREGTCCFAMVRPPGHHAERDQAMGFCLLNNAAIAAAKALDDVDRVAIVDWDVHHGNGTQHAFYRSPRVLYCSVHARGCFPGTGYTDETGEGEGKGFTINAPLESGSGGSDYFQVFSRVFAPAIARFRPDVCLISAGQDMLSDDPLGPMNLCPGDVGVLTSVLLGVLDVPPAFVLEGGYGPSHAAAIRAIFEAIQTEAHTEDDALPPARESTEQVVNQLRHFHHLESD